MSKNEEWLTFTLSKNVKAGDVFRCGNAVVKKVYEDGHEVMMPREYKACAIVDTSDLDFNRVRVEATGG